MRADTISFVELHVATVCGWLLIRAWFLFEYDYYAVYYADLKFNLYFSFYKYKVQVSILCIQVQELACECLISLTHHQHNPQWLRHQLRLLGGLDILANLG